MSLSVLIDAHIRPVAKTHAEWRVELEGPLAVRPGLAQDHLDPAQGKLEEPAGNRTRAAAALADQGGRRRGEGGYDAADQAPDFVISNLVQRRRVPPPTSKP